MSPLLRNRHFQLFVAACGVSLAVLAADGRPVGEVIGALAILGLFLPLVAIAAFAVQALLGSQFKRLLGGDSTDTQRLLGGVLCFAWMSLEAGLVEEFFFRWFLQSRLAARLGSEVSGLFLGALVFGLAHAPGILLRGADAVEGLGDAPGLATTLAYVVVTQGVAGLVFGVLWSAYPQPVAGHRTARIFRRAVEHGHVRGHVVALTTGHRPRAHATH